MTSGFEFLMTTKRGNRIVKKKFSNKEKMLSLIRGPKPEERKATYKSLLQVFEKNSGVLGEIYLNRVIEWRDEYMDLRGFRSPISVRNVYNNLDDQQWIPCLQYVDGTLEFSMNILQKRRKCLALRSCKDTTYMLLYH